MKELIIERAEFVGLKEQVDYERLTVEIMDKEMRIIPYGRFFKKDIMDIVNMENRKDLIYKVVKYTESRHNVTMFLPTKPLPDIAEVYRLKEDMIDFNRAIDCGFGIIRVLKGKYEGQYFLYNSEIEKEYVPLMLDVYLQLVLNNYDNKDLEKFINTKEGEITLKKLCNSDDISLVDKLRESYSMKKGGNNIVKFRSEANEA